MQVYPVGQLFVVYFLKFTSEVRCATMQRWTAVISAQPMAPSVQLNHSAGAWLRIMLQNPALHFPSTKRNRLKSSIFRDFRNICFVWFGIKKKQLKHNSIFWIKNGKKPVAALAGKGPPRRQQWKPEESPECWALGGFTRQRPSCQKAYAFIQVSHRLKTTDCNFSSSFQKISTLWIWMAAHAIQKGFPLFEGDPRSIRNNCGTRFLQLAKAMACVRQKKGNSWVALFGIRSFRYDLYQTTSTRFWKLYHLNHGNNSELRIQILPRNNDLPRNSTYEVKRPPLVALPAFAFLLN